MDNNKRQPTQSLDHLFSADYSREDLKKNSLRGGLFTVFGQWGKFILQTMSTIVLARLLTPEDYGLIAMVTALTGFIGMFKDLGLSIATIQRREITHSQVSSLFWINVLISMVLMFLVFAAAPVVALFYQEPRLIAITLALGCSFLISGLAIQHQALLRRQMRFSVLAFLEVIAMFTGIVVAILSALILDSLGLGVHKYWALVLMQISSTLAITIGVWLNCKWLPGRPAWDAEIRSMLAFGGNLAIFDFVNYFARNLDNVLIGRYWGGWELGLYNKAYALLLLPIQQINEPIRNVAIPALSRMQNDPDNYRAFYLRAMNFIAFTTTPMVVMLAVLSDEIVILLLGNNWLGVSIIFKVLAVAAFVQPYSNATGWIYTSLGRSRRMRNWGFLGSSLTILSFFLGLKWQGVGVAAAYAACSLALQIPALKYAFKDTPITLGSFFLSVWRPMFLSVIMFLVMSLVRYQLSPVTNEVVTIIGSSLAGLLCLAGGVLIWPGARIEFFKIIANIKELRSKPSNSK